MKNEFDLKARLTALAQEDYRSFSMRLNPGVGDMLGVRLPALRSLARELIDGDWRAFLARERDEFFEETMLRGMVIGGAKCTESERLSLIINFLPRINCWSICDSFCASLHSARQHPEEYWELLLTFFGDGREYYARFAAVMGLSYFVDEHHLSALLKELDSMPAQGFYARMGVAWALSVCFVKFPEASLAYLGESHLDDFTYNRTLRKIIESSRASEPQKAVLRGMIRR